MRVWLSRAESADWSDYEFRETLLQQVRHQTLKKGRKFFEIYSNDGNLLRAGAA